MSWATVARECGDHGSRFAAAFAVALAWSGGGCASQPVPDPRVAALSYANAATRGDAAALYGMMTKEEKHARSPRDIELLVASERAELSEQGRALSSRDVRVEGTARLRYADGEEAALDLRRGSYGVTAAASLPGGGRTPEETLDSLRRVLARRSYAGLLRVLSPSARAAFESDMQGLVEGLAEPAGLPLQVSGDSAVVALPGGHQVKLRRDQGVWRVEDFD